MKPIYKYILLLTFLLSALSQVSSQVKISKIREEHKNTSLTEWSFYSEKTWKYNSLDNAYHYLSQNRSWIPNSQTLTLYNEKNNISYQKYSLEIDSIFEDKHEIYYYYDSRNRIEEILLQGLKTSQSSELYSQKDEFYYSENSMSHIKYESFEEPKNWKKIYSVDSIYNESNCLTEVTKIDFIFGNQIFRTYKQFWEYYDNCKIKTYTEWEIKSNGDIDSKTRTKYEYEVYEDSIISLIIYDSYDSHENQWEQVYKRYKHENKDRLLTKELTEYYSQDYNYIDTSLELYDYNSRGNLRIFERYETRYNLNNLPLQLVNRDSFCYIYDENNILRSELYFSNHTNVPQYRTITDYAYYCNDLLEFKTTSTSDGFQSRLHYEYYKPPICDQGSSEKLEVSIFPNPTIGEVRITSNTFFNPNSIISLYSLDGKTVISKRYNYLSNEILLQIPNEVKDGMYILTIENDASQNSEFILLQRN